MTADAYQVEVVRDDDGLRALREDWAGLYRESVPVNPFLSYEWAAACRTHVCRKAEPYVVTARADGRLVGLAALRRDRLRGFRILRFIGSGWSEYVGFLSSPDHPNARAALLEGLAERRSEWDLLLLRQLAAEFSGLDGVPRPKTMGGGSTAGEGSPFIAFPGDWEALCSERRAWHKDVRYRVRRFEREGGTVERFRGSSAAERMIEAADVEAHSWQGRYGQPLFQDESVRALFREAFRELDSRGEMELWIARVGGRPVAYKINFLTPDRLWLYRYGYHEDYARYGLGFVLEFHSMRHAWMEGRREYDYLSGCERYKLERTNTVRPMEMLAWYPRTPRGRLAFALLVAPRWRLKQLSAGRAALQFLSRVKQCPQAILPWNRALRERVH